MGWNADVAASTNFSDNALMVHHWPIRFFKLARLQSMTILLFVTLTACSKTGLLENESEDMGGKSPSFSEIAIGVDDADVFLREKVIVAGPSFQEVYYDNHEWLGVFTEIDYRQEHGRWKVEKSEAGKLSICIDLNDDNGLPSTQRGYICRTAQFGADPSYMRLQDLFGKEVVLVKILKLSQYNQGVFQR